MKPFLYALLFIVIGLVACALIVPLVLHGGEANRKAGQWAFPVIVLIGGISGFLFGLRRQKKQ